MCRSPLLSAVVHMKMETLEEKQSTTTCDRLVNNLLPSDIITEILSRLPVKSLLRLTSVSKPWLSYISDPSFTKLHRTRVKRIAFFLSACDFSTHKTYFFSVTDDGKPAALLMTLHDYGYISGVQHFNGLICFTFRYYTRASFQADAFVINPSTRKFFKLPYPDCLKDYTGEACYFFGFDESRNEHKILKISIRRSTRDRTAEIIIYSLSDYSWRRIDVEAPFGFSLDRMADGTEASVCVNSVVYFVVDRDGVRYEILGFDLRTEKLSVISTPEEVVARGYCVPCIRDINGCIGVVCFNHMKESNEMHFWILQNGVWVREIVKFPRSWINLAGPGPSIHSLDVNMDEIIFYKSKVSGNVMSLRIYDKKRRCFKSLRFTLGHQFPRSNTLRLNKIKFYVESLASVRNTTDSSPHAQPATSERSIRSPAQLVTSARPIRTKRTPARFTDWGPKYPTESTLKRKRGDTPRGKTRKREAKDSSMQRDPTHHMHREKEGNGVDSRVTMKAKVGSYKIKFLLPIQEVSLAAINTEIQNRFEGLGSYKVKYLRGEEWYLIAIDEDIQDHIKSLKSNKRVVEICIESREEGGTC